VGPNISEGKYALGALTLFALWLFVGLPWLFTSGWGLSDKIAVIASAATLLQFVALLATVWVMIANGRRQLRAYLGLLRHDIHDERHEFVIVVRNDGQTPAREVIPFFNFQWYALGKDMPADFHFADYPQPSDGSGAIFVTPGQEHPWSFAMDWARFQQFNAGQIGQFYLYGRFEYVDVFGAHHESQFCYQAVRFTGGGGAFRVYSRHNDCT
jgi:hypothetical protein